jgi:hypothetical protein
VKHVQIIEILNTFFKLIKKMNLNDNLKGSYDNGFNLVRYKTFR